MHLVYCFDPSCNAAQVDCAFQPLTRLGAEVTGIDASAELIKVAKWHAELDSSINSRVTYKMSTVEDLRSSNKADDCVQLYDGVVASEIVEHVSDAELFVNACCSLVKVPVILLIDEESFGDKFIFSIFILFIYYCKFVFFKCRND